MKPVPPAVLQALQQAIAEIGAGRLDSAARILDGNRAALGTNVGQNIRGDIHLKQGRFADALRAFDAAIKLAPQMPEAHANRSAALEALGRYEDALAAADRALRYRPNYALAHYNRGNILKARHRMTEAAEAYTRAIRAQPQHAEALLNRGLARVRLNQPLDALADFNRALSVRPRFVAAHVGRAAAYRDIGDFAQAFGAIDAAVTIDPDNLDAALIRSAVLITSERYDEALASAAALVERYPDSPAARTALAAALWKLKRLPEALAVADAAVGLAPQDDDAHAMRGIILGELGELEQSLAALETARSFGASGADYHHARAVALAALGDPDESMAAFEQALALRPNDPLAHYNRAFLYLSLGRFEEGWAEHEWRLKTRELRNSEKRGLAPDWQGQDLAGRKILLHSEQGHGDTIQFSRYVPLVAAKGAQITLLVQEPLRRLLEANFPDIDVTGSLGMRRGFDYQASLLSLPAIFRTTADTIPHEVPYLRADDVRVAKWRARIGQHGFKVGIVWQGNPTYSADRYRSPGIGPFLPLVSVPGVRLISLQAFGAADALKTLPQGISVETLGEEIVNNPDGFREVAAAMMALDLTIMSDTGPAHLAGALALPVWVALRDRPDWRWMRSGATTPWYPTMRLFRQQRPRDWEGVFAAIRADLMASAAKVKAT